jgi:uncharacterized membrane protein YdcZ (DUF606 family)
LDDLNIHFAIPDVLTFEQMGELILARVTSNVCSGTLFLQGAHLVHWQPEGASLVFGIAFLIPRVGAGRFTITMLAGQILAGLVLSHFGWLGSAREPISAKTLIGAVVMFAGVVLATF